MPRIYLTGRVLLEASTVTIDESGLGGRQGRLLLAYLVLERRRPAPMDELVDLLWPDRPPMAPEVSIRALVSRLRRCLQQVGFSGGALTTASGCLQIHLGADAWIDFEAAMTAIDAAEGKLRAGNPAAAFPPAATASAISGRDFLPGEAVAWAVGKRSELRETRIRALEAMADVLCRLGQWSVAAKVGHDLVTLEPLRETAYAWLMRAQVGAGNRGEALLTYHRCRERLEQELGVAPSAALERLFMELLRRASD